MDIEQILEDMEKNGIPSEEAGDSSESDASKVGIPAETETPSAETEKSVGAEGNDSNIPGDGEPDGNGHVERNGQDGTDGVAARDSDKPSTEGGEEGSGTASDGDAGTEYRRKPLSDLEKAQFKAEKWKKLAKQRRREFNELKGQFDKYRNLNPMAFENEEERMEFLAWKASTAQKLQDMSDSMAQMQDEHDLEVRQQKIDNCYNERGAYEFEKLDDYYGHAFDKMCEMVDPDNVIKDYLRNSPYEPAMKHVIYKNAQLQNELIRSFGNKAIDASERVRILKNLERDVHAFYARQQGVPQGNGRPQRQQQRQQQENTAAQRQNNGQAQQGRRFTLPSMQSKNAQQAFQPRPAVTGSLTRGSETASQPDMSSVADRAYKELFGKSGI